MLDIERSELGIAEDTRTAIQRMRRRDIWLKFEKAGIEYDPQATKEDLVKLAVKRMVDLEKAPKSEDPIVHPEPSIHDLRRDVKELKAWQGRWNEIVKMSKEDLQAVLRGDDPT